MKTILITGITGFLGSHLAHRFINSDYNVIGLIRNSSNILRINSLIERIKLYNINEINLEDIFIENKINIVIHTATNYGRTNESLSEILEVNINLPISIFQFCNKYGTEVFFNSDTFFNTDSLHYEYLTAYTKTKHLIVELMKCQSYSCTKFINIKLQHMYGPDDSENKFIPWFLSQLKQNISHIDLTSGIQKRDFVYIDDVVEAYFVLLKNINILLHNEEYDVGTGESIEFREFLLKIYSEFCNQQKDSNFTKIITELRFGAKDMRKGEPLEIKANIIKLRILGWAPSHIFNNFSWVNG
jgi:CDP-paratose synthetase